MIKEFLKPNKWKMIYTLALVLLDIFIRQFMFNLSFNMVWLIFYLIIGYVGSSLIISIIDKKYDLDKRKRIYIITLVTMLSIFFILFLFIQFIIIKIYPKTIFDT